MSHKTECLPRWFAVVLSVQYYVTSISDTVIFEVRLVVSRYDCLVEWKLFG